MANGIYVGSASKAAKVKRILVGDESLARRVRAGYIGINGVARRFYHPVTTVALAANAQSLDAAKTSTCGGELASYAVFAAGQGSSSAYTTTVEAYDAALTKSTTDALYAAVRFPAAARAGGSLVICGGATTSAIVKTACSYSNALVKDTLSNMGSSRHLHIGISIGESAFFAGGRPIPSTNEPTLATATTEIFSSAGVRSSGPVMSNGRASAAAARAGKYTLVGGGNRASYIEGESGGYTVYTPTDCSVGSVDVFSPQITKMTPLDMYKRMELGGASAGGCAIFAGGREYNTESATVNIPRDYVQAFDQNLVLRNLAPLTAASSYARGQTVEGAAIFASCSAANVTSYTCYNSDLVKTDIVSAASPVRKEMALAAVGEYVLIAGGSSSSRLVTALKIS